MAQTNRKRKAPVGKTFEGAVAARINPEQLLRRLLMAHLLWENTFYVDGQSAAEAMVQAVKDVAPAKVAAMAIEAREQMKLRHAPLLIVRAMARLDTHKGLVSQTLSRVIQRPDELCEYVSLYLMDRPEGKRLPTKLSKQSKLGLALAFRKFSEYQLAKYNRPGTVTLRDVLFLCHAKPINDEQEELWKRLKDNKLATPDTWETALTATKGKDKDKEWGRLLAEGKLGALALLRNLRNMREAGVSGQEIAEALDKMNLSRVLPFRFIAAAQHNAQFESWIEKAMYRAVKDLPKLPGKTALVVDVSGSMFGPKISEKSELDRADAACALAILARELCQEVVVIAYSTDAHVVPDRRGFGLRDAIKHVPGAGGGTNTLKALIKAESEGYNRIIVITDEQSHQNITPPVAGTTGYFLNVANYTPGIGYGAWTNMTGFSEALMQYIAAAEGLTDGSQTGSDDRED